MPEHDTARDGLQAACAKMRDAGIPEPAIDVFAVQYGRLREGDSGTIPTGELQPVRDVPVLEDLPDAPPDALARTVVVKLNGGLGTSMGLRKAKSLIEARDGRTFLELIIGQLEAIRSSAGVELPLVLLDSFRTRADTREALGERADVTSVLQHREPRLRAEDLWPVEWPAEPELEWCPPGHGDVYLALSTSGVLDDLLDRGFRQAFLSNGDNLGAVVEPRIAAWAAAEGLPFAMEVVRGTAADRKGGHVARRGGRLLLRETAQVPPGEEESFGDFERWRYYNTNNLWVDLEALRDLLARESPLALPLIVNRKRVDPDDRSSPQVVQLETAMGAALGRFEGAGLVHVPRTRFAPVKTTDDLLILRSDAYATAPDGRVVPARETPPFVDLDRAHYTGLAEFDARFPYGAPSLARCERLVVRGDVTFGAGVIVAGDVTIEAPEPRRIPDGAVLDGHA